MERNRKKPEMESCRKSTQAMLEKVTSRTDIL